jgi:hypothetical protein
LKIFKTAHLLILIIGLSLITTCYAEDMEYTSKTVMAEDSNCKECHSGDVHVIHESTSATCQGCHGASLTDRQPECSKCHYGSIHSVHSSKVNSENCSYCHEGLDQLHVEFISDTVCVHCHKDLLDVHGGPTDSCEICHGTSPDIVIPVTGSNDVIVCQGCHISTDVAALHGEADNVSSCYMCHRPGSTEMNESEIPHFIHVPEVPCENCHLSSETGEIIIPECIACHAVDTLHGYDQIALKTSSTGLDCSVCHPMMEGPDDPSTPSTATEDSTSGTEIETDETNTTETDAEGTPGFGAILAFSILAVVYLIRKRN